MITFWRVSDEYGVLSNFSNHSITVDGKKYKTCEHYYQAMKLSDEYEHEMVRTAISPKTAKQTAYLYKAVDNWEEIKYDIMLKALRAKVEQHSSVRKKILETGDNELGESSPYDYIWGLGKDGSGTNLLGKAWMQIREEVKSASSTVSS